MMLLGLDLASRLTGWCAGVGSEVPLCGAWAIPEVKGDYGMLLASLEEYLEVAGQRFLPDAVAYEAPILIARGNAARYGDKLSTLRLLYPMGAFVEYWCRRRGIPCYEVTVQAIKKAVTDNHIADKADLVLVAKRCGLELPSGPGAMDAADAFGAWLLLLRSTSPRLGAEWDKRIHSPRHGLL